MPTAPSSYLNWCPSASASSTTVIQPPTGVSNVGWTAASAPAYQYMNWLFYQTDQWIQYLAVVALVAPTAATVNANTVVVTTTGTIVNGSYVMASVANTTGVKPGQLITGTGIPSSTYVTYTSGSVVYMSQPATSNQTGESVTFGHGVATGSTIQTQLDELDTAVRAAGTSVYTGYAALTSASTAMTGVTPTTNIVPGMSATGTGIPSGALVVSVSGSQVNLSTALTATSSSTAVGFSHGTAVGAGLQIQLDQLDGAVSLGAQALRAVSSGVIESTTGTIITGTTNSTTSVTSLSSSTGIQVGMAISGSGIPTGTIVTGIAGSTLTMSNAATASASGVALSFSHVVATGSNIQTQLDQLDGAVSILQVPYGPIAINPSTTSSFTPISGAKYYVNSANGACQVNLPSPVAGFSCIVVDTGGNWATDNLTVHRYSSENINGLAANLVVTNSYGEITIRSDGTNWFVVAEQGAAPGTLFSATGSAGSVSSTTAQTLISLALSLPGTYNLWSLVNFSFTGSSNEFIAVLQTSAGTTLAQDQNIYPPAGSTFVSRMFAPGVVVPPGGLTVKLLCQLILWSSGQTLSWSGNNLSASPPYNNILYAQKIG